MGRDLSVDFMIPGLLGMILFFTATSISPVVVPWEAQARTLERLMSCPVSLETIIVGDVLASFAFGAAVSLVPIAIGLALGMTVSGPLVLGAAIMVAALCFASLGNVFSVAPTNLPSTVMMISSVVKFPLVFISGIFISLDELPAWGQAIAYVSPLTYFTDIARSSLQDRGQLPVAVDFGVLVAFSFLFLLVAVKLHQRTMPRRI